MGKKSILAAALLAAGAGPALAVEGFDWGVDFRFRVTELGDIPTNAGSLVFDQLFIRYRTRDISSLTRPPASAGAPMCA